MFAQCFEFGVRRDDVIKRRIQADNRRKRLALSKAMPYFTGQLFEASARRDIVGGPATLESP
jgi:hypothetical protein